MACNFVQNVKLKSHRQIKNWQQEKLWFSLVKDGWKSGQWRAVRSFPNAYDLPPKNQLWRTTDLVFESSHGSLWTKQHKAQIILQLWVIMLKYVVKWFTVFEGDMLAATQKVHVSFWTLSICTQSCEQLRAWLSSHPKSYTTFERTKGQLTAQPLTLALTLSVKLNVSFFHDYS